MAYTSPKESKKLVGGIMRMRTLIILGLALLALLFYPTIRNMTTSYEAMVVEKIDGSMDYSTRKGSVRHAGFKEIVLCDGRGREFEKYVRDEDFSKYKEGGFVKKDILEDQHKVVDTVATAEQIKLVCKIHPPQPKPAPAKKAETAPQPPPPPAPEEKPVVPAVK
jgi:hypothetical protein